MKNVARVKEQSSTTGLSSYELASSGSLYRRFRDEFATGERVRYYAASAADFEEGLGILTYGTPDVLSRDTIIRSSQGGGKINWPAGTRDLFVDPLPGNHPVIAQAGAYAVTIFDHGLLIRFTGTTATWTLPAAAAVGDGFSFEVRNDGTGDLTLDAAGSEQINGALTIVIKPGSSGFIRCSGTAWHGIGISALDIVGLTEELAPDFVNDFVPIYDASAIGNKKVPLGRAGRLVQRAYDEERAYTNYPTGSYTHIPLDDTRPEITEGVEILSVTITPRSASNRIRARAVVPYGPNVGMTMLASIHRGGQALASSWQYSNGGGWAMTSVVELEEPSPGTTAVTYSVRLGASTSAAGFEMGATGATGARRLGGAACASLVVEEFVP